MTPSKLCLFIGVCALLLLGSSWAEDDKDENKARSNSQKDNMEHLFPLLFMMNGAPAVHSPAIWLVSMLSLAVAFYLGRSNFEAKNS